MTDLFTTPSGILVVREATVINDEKSVTEIIEQLNYNYGVYLSSGVEFPDRYSRWDFGIIDPPLSIVGVSSQLKVTALNERGSVILKILKPLLSRSSDVHIAASSDYRLVLDIFSRPGIFAEEDRSLQPSLFTPLRTLMEDFIGIPDEHMGFYGAFGFDLIYQFDQPKLPIERMGETSVLHLFFPDRIYIFDRRKETAIRYDYELSRNKLSSLTVARQKIKNDVIVSYRGEKNNADLKHPITVDIEDKQFVRMVNKAREAMRQGDIFEVVLSRSFRAPFFGIPSSLFHAIRHVNPSPYEFFFQFGKEQLVGASPEMFVRVEGRRIESCPISGTVRRGTNAMEDSENVRALLNSEKDEVELTMCTDVDRNDKARICKPGSVRLLGRRMIERYAGLFHTVDHVEGYLRDNLTGLDAFLSHMWAVTLTGAPKRAAVATLEKLENEARGWYGGAVGALFLNGNVNTGITIRTVRLADSIATYRAGSTLVWDSIGIEEAKETRTKADAFFRILQPKKSGPKEPKTESTHILCKVILIDNEDSFIHTLGDYLRQAGASVSTFRHGIPLERLTSNEPDLVVHSPGPGRPTDFKVPEIVLDLAKLKIPQFGVCLGLQGIVEAFGGTLKLLQPPRHGKRWTVEHVSDGLFAGVPSPCDVGAYHSLVVEKLPDVLEVTAKTTDGLIMGVRHRDLPIEALQFHPESILSMRQNVGHRLVSNLLTPFCSR